MAEKHVKSYENKQYVLINAWALTKKDLAAVLEIDVRTLEKYYSEEMSKSRAGIVSKTVEAAHLALSEVNGSVINTMLKGLCGLSETNKLEVTGKDGEPLMPVNRPKELTHEEWVETYGSSVVDVTEDDIVQ